MADAKPMRSVRRSAVTQRIELNGTGHTHYYYDSYDPNDDLAKLLAQRVHKSVETRIMQHSVQERLAKEMDTGIRVNHALARAYGVTTTDSSSSSPSSPTKGDGTTKGLGARLLVIGERLAPEDEDARGLALVDVCWNSDV